MSAQYFLRTDETRSLTNVRRGACVELNSYIQQIVGEEFCETPQDWDTAIKNGLRPSPLQT